MVNNTMNQIGRDMSVSMDSKVRNDLYNIMSDPKSKTVDPKGDSHVFLKIIEASGKEISGRVAEYDQNFVKINYYVDDDADLDKEKTIQIKNISSISLLEKTHPIIFAYKHYGSKFKYNPRVYNPIVHIESKDGETFTGEFTGMFRCNGSKKFFRIYLIPAENTFWIEDYPIESTKSIRVLPYTSDSIRSFKGNRSKEVKEVLRELKLLLPPLAEIVAGYLPDEGPDELPKNIYDYFIKNPDRRIRNMSGE